MSDIIPVFLGADLNCYNFARAFHEAYGVESYAYGRYPMAPTKYSKIIHFTTVPDMDNEDTMLRILHEFAAQHKGKRLYLFGCTDDYAAMIIRRKAELTEYIAPGPAADLYGSIQKKAEFYEVCEKFGIPYPDSKILTAPVDAAELTEDKLGFAYPIIVKPSSSVDYWKHPFDTMKKVYPAATPAEAAEIVKTIYASGKGATPEYALNSVLKSNGLDPEKDVTIEYKSEHAEVVAALAEDQTAVGLLPQPFVTTALMKNENLRVALDLNELWESSATDGSRLVTGVVIARNDYLKEHEADIDAFMDAYKDSVEFVNSDTEAAAQIIGNHDIIPAEVAAKAIPECSIVFMEGDEMQTILSGYLNTLNEQNPETIGGQLPDEDFYYKR